MIPATKFSVEFIEALNFFVLKLNEYLNEMVATLMVLGDERDASQAVSDIMTQYIADVIADLPEEEREDAIQKIADDIRINADSADFNMKFQSFGAPGHA